MRYKIAFISLFSFYLFSCNGQNTQVPPAITSAEPIKINRFDRELFQYIESKEPTQQEKLRKDYAQMLDILGKGILNLKSPDATHFFERLISYYSEPTLKGLYADALQQYVETSQIEQALGNGFAWLKQCFPTMQIPAVYMHVSGFNQNVLVGDSLLSISIDKYLGADYPLYQNFFYGFQRQLMTPAQVVPDYLAGWILSEYPFEGRENVLLDRMVYEGKIKFLLQQAFPELQEEALMGYTQEELNWCKVNESKLWKAIIERKHLYTPDQMATAKYFESTPCSFLSSDAPGNIGVWIGWQIVNKYMKETQSSAEVLMNNNDSQAILAASKYKP